LSAPPARITPPSRNAPCTCGSGRRYKDCHGAIEAVAGAPESLAGILARALADQQAGRIPQAIAGYENALAVAPDHFDALHMLGVAHFQRGEFERALALVDRAVALRSDDAGARFNRRLIEQALARGPAAAELEREAAAFAASIDGAHTGDDRAVRVIAFYLPQYHRIPENDAWWGEGFTEWTNVRRGRAMFAGHAQPHVPGELGYYELTDPAVREAQAALARAYGIDAFCYYYYWFGGRRLLERPFDEVLASARPDFPFCVCWANEHWTRRWDGLDHEILMAQRYSEDDARAFIEALVPAFRDPRYVRVGGHPLLLVYRIADIPDVGRIVAIWRDACRAAGVGEIHLAAVQRNALDDPTPFGFDAAVEFPPIGHAAENVTARMPELDPAFRGSVYNYANLAADYLLRPRPAFPQYRGVTPMWDNTARRPGDGMVVDGSTPDLFGVWLEQALRQTRRRHRDDARLVFVNAWNEWAEGNHLEPDARHGRRFLGAVRAARERACAPDPARPRFDEVVRATRAVASDGAIAIGRLDGAHRGAAREARDGGVSVVMPVHNHARFLPRALESLAAQSRLPDELVAVDDGSSDDSAEAIRAFARGAPFPVTLVRQRNAGAHVALNRGMALAGGATIALLNSDDAYAPERLEHLTAALDDGHVLAFSGVALVDDDDRPADSPYARELDSRLREAAAAPELLRVLVRHNAAVSTGNLVFRRSLLDATGGFAALRVCHDWDFVLSATFATQPRLVAGPLYVYRLHRANTFSGLTLAGRLEGDVVLSQFFAQLPIHPAFDAAGLAAFRAFARAEGLGGYL
jgi:tetratricopeptide (TPR) repeat protein